MTGEFNGTIRSGTEMTSHTRGCVGSERIREGSGNVAVQSTGAEALRQSPGAEGSSASCCKCRCKRECKEFIGQIRATSNKLKEERTQTLQNTQDDSCNPGRQANVVRCWCWSHA